MSELLVLISLLIAYGPIGLIIFLILMMVFGKR